MKKRILAVVTVAVLALGCFTTVSAKHNANVYEALAIVRGTRTAEQLDCTINAAQKKAAKAINKRTVINGNMSLDYRHETDDYELTVAGWNLSNQYNHLTHLYAQAGTEKVIRVFKIIADDAATYNPIKVIIPDSDIKAGKKYGLRHFNDGVWDNTCAKVTKVVNGVVYAEITDASPFALVELKN